ncbi:MAG: glycosyltransferase family 4 protein [Anaerolineae bacterium]|nr:glycosyltransferase family 4 protein [Anaerolineae bacterium]
MRVLYLSQYFPPEVGATQTRAYEMASGLVRAGHEVTVLTEAPNHPEGIIPPDYRGKLWARENLNGIDVVRVWVKASPVKTLRTRLLFYISYMLNALLAGLFKARGRYDVIYATSPPLFVGGAALALSWLRRLPLVFEVRDLWPESAVALGELNNPRFVRWASRLERACYRRARRIVVVTQGIYDRLRERGLPPEKLRLITNGANTDLFMPGPIDRAARRDLGIAEDTYVAVYTGLHGLIHGMDVILEAAQHFLDRGIDEQALLFLLIGSGVRKPYLVEKAASLNLTNVRFLDAQPESELPRFIKLADAGIATTAKMALTKGSLPVKMFSYMACGRPVLLAVDGEARALVEATETGLYTPPEDAGALVAALERLRADPELGRRMGRNGRRLVEARFSRQAQARDLVSLLETLI